MPFVCQLIEGSLPAIDLYAAEPGFGLLNQGIRLNAPEEIDIWGGRLQDQLVRTDEGKRIIPLEMDVRELSDVALIDAVNALQERLNHAARYRVDGWGDEIFLEFNFGDAPDAVRFPVLKGTIDATRLMEIFNKGTHGIDRLPVELICEAHWEDDETFSLENYVDNPGFWRGAVAPGDSWTEVDPAGNLTLEWETGAGLYVFMGRSLKWTIAPDAANDLGIRSDNIAVESGTAYRFEARGYHTNTCDPITVQVYDVTNGGVIAATIRTFDNQDNAWEKIGVNFSTPIAPLPCVSVRIEEFRLLGDSTAGDKVFRSDGFYLDKRTTGAPIGWCSGRNLVAHQDGDADHLNTFVVAELPGEAQAEINLKAVYVDPTTDINYLHVAKRTREDPHKFTWALLGVDAVVTAGDATCKDTSLSPSPDAPGGQKVVCTFATSQALARRCYWDITAELASHYGRFMPAVLCRATASTDTIKLAVRTYDSGTASQGGDVLQTVLTAPADTWRLLTGWQVSSFPFNDHDGDLWDTGNYWRIELLASIAGSSPWDNLEIAGLFLIPLDEAYLLSYHAQVYTGCTTGVDYYIKEMDGDRGIFPHDRGNNIRHSGIEIAGEFPLLEPEIENWLHFLWYYSGAYLITKTLTVSVTYRPRGVFLRGTNP